jgi:hemerythrin-like domain-containing protein
MDTFNKGYVLNILETIESEINKVVSMTSSFSLQKETNELKKQLKNYIELVENSINKEEKEFDLLLPSIQSFYLNSENKKNDTKKTRFPNKLQPIMVHSKRPEDNNIPKMTPFKRSEDNVIFPVPFKRIEEDKIIPKKVPFQPIESDTVQKKQCVEEHNVTRDFIDGLENLLESLKKKYY